MAVKLLVANYIGGSDGFTDRDGKDYDWKDVDVAGVCVNCGRDVTGDGEVLVNLDEERDEFWCTGCIITQSVPQIIQAYEDCRKTLDKLIKVQLTK